MILYSSHICSQTWKLDSSKIQETNQIQQPWARTRKLQLRCGRPPDLLSGQRLLHQLRRIRRLRLQLGRWSRLTATKQQWVWPPQTLQVRCHKQSEQIIQTVSGPGRHQRVSCSFIFNKRQTSSETKWREKGINTSNKLVLIKSFGELFIALLSCLIVPLIDNFYTGLRNVHDFTDYKWQHSINKSLAFLERIQFQSKKSWEKTNPESKLILCCKWLTTAHIKCFF